MLPCSSYMLRLGPPPTSLFVQNTNVGLCIVSTIVFVLRDPFFFLYFFVDFFFLAFFHFHFSLVL